MRVDGRAASELRDIVVKRGFNSYAEGSVLIEWGRTVVHCTASVEDKVPSFMRGTGSGWVSAEYSMLPRATDVRMSRDISRGKLSGRSSEIQRLIGRALRAAVDLAAIGERTIWLDCDVLQADGGTRTASITASFIALVDALRTIVPTLSTGTLPLEAQIAALSVGKVEGDILLDLCYEEDSNADVDFNVVGSSKGEYVELQGTGEDGYFSRAELNDILNIADDGLKKLFKLQREVLQLTSYEEAVFDEIAGA